MQWKPTWKLLAGNLINTNNNMNIDQKNALLREILTALLALVASFNLLSHEMASNAVALIGAVIMWFIAYRSGASGWGSFARKAAQAVSPVLLQLGVINVDQSTALTATLLVLVGLWTSAEKSTESK